MEFVKHKLFGTGEVVSRDGKYLVVRFKNNDEKKFVIPQSFQLGILMAEGELQKEIDTAIKAKEEISKKNQIAYVDKSETAPRRTRTSVNVEVVGKIATSYEAYLIKKGYKTETDKGLPSTVYAYIKAVDFVLDEENLSWSALVDKIHIVIKKYDIGGEKEHLGNKSNKTVINALKRFQDYDNQM